MTAEERMMWVERYSALPTGNVADAMDGLGLKRGSVLGLHPIDPSQKRAAGFARTIFAEAPEYTVGRREPGKARKSDR
ncbi:MAG: hypothetical protein ACLTR6_12880 [Clostridium fessum]